MSSPSWMIGAALSAVLATATANANEPPAGAANISAATPAEARIAFSSRNIWNWDVLDEQTVLIQSNSRKWYQAKLLGNCTGLRFVERIGFKSNADDSFDKFSSIELSSGQRCPLVSLTVSDGPPKKAKKSAPRPAADAAKH